jgi:Cu-Zn family superoxide dismutase
MKQIKMLLGCLAVALLPAFLLAETGRAMISGTTDKVPISGEVALLDTSDGLKVTVHILQAPPGSHAFHIHEFGSCDDEGKAAGAHYNPAGHPHGNLLKDGFNSAHAGDMGNITIGVDGTGSLEAVIPHVALSQGVYNVAGRAFILHEKVDDFSQPAGNAGARIGCGPIVLIKE